MHSCKDHLFFSIYIADKYIGKFINSMCFKFTSKNYILYVLFFTCNILCSESKKFNELGLPTIIWWTDLLFPHLGTESEIKCLSGSCVSATKRMYKNDYLPLTYLFYGSDFEPETLPLPRQNNNIWALFHEESPMNNYILSHTPGITLFNFTSTFSRYSDFPVTTQSIPSLKYFTERKPVSTEVKNKFRKKGFAPIIYLQSHCNVASDRDNYVRELMKLIDIDAYGVCLHNRDLPDHLTSTRTYDDESLFDFISKYKFHLAFENAICDDYITEKLYRALHVGSVPIYKGSSTVREWLPCNHSAILVDDFSSPKELADFISVVDENDDMYNVYLKFKETGVINNFLINEILSRTWGVNDIEKMDFIQAFECYLCDHMHTLNKSSVPFIANKRHMNCHQPHPSLHQEKIDKMWQQEEWIESYWFSYDKAKAIQLMIQNNDNDTSNYMTYILKQRYQN